jgi:hypothetical protein
MMLARDPRHDLEHPNTIERQIREPFVDDWVLGRFRGNATRLPLNTGEGLDRFSKIVPGSLLDDRLPVSFIIAEHQIPGERGKDEECGYEKDDRDWNGSSFV